MLMSMGLLYIRQVEKTPEVTKEAIDQISQDLQEQKCSNTILIQGTITALVQNSSMTDMYPPLLKSLAIKKQIYPSMQHFIHIKALHPFARTPLTPVAPTD